MPLRRVKTEPKSEEGRKARCPFVAVVGPEAEAAFQRFSYGLGKSGQLSMRNAGVRSLVRLSKQLGWLSSSFATWEAKCPPHQLSRLPEP